MGVKVFHVDRDFVRIPYIHGASAKAIIWPGVGGKLASVHYFVYEPGQESVAHTHPNSEDVFYIVEGEGLVIDKDSGIAHPVSKGNVVLVEPGTFHQLKATGTGQFINVGGPCPPDLEMYRRAGLIK